MYFCSITQNGTMKRYLFLVFAIFLFISCDDGTIIVTDFDFNSDSELQLCKTESSTNVLFIVNSDPDESIAFNFSDEDFDGTYEDIEEDEQIITIELDESDRLVYRTYDGSIDNTYFCSGIPPTSPKVTGEYISKSGGSIDIITTLIDEEPGENNTVICTFVTRAVAHNVTLKNSSSDEEIVEAELQLGSFKKTAQFEVLGPPSENE